MTKNELLKTIINGKNVWSIDYIDHKRIVNKYTSNHIKKILAEYDNESDRNEHMETLSKILFKTKDEAEHYLKHANVTRTERLPFLTWKEFKRHDIAFRDPFGDLILMYYEDKSIIIYNADMKNEIYFDFTEENFYLAYDECVKLFKGE